MSIRDRLLISLAGVYLALDVLRRHRAGRVAPTPVRRPVAINLPNGHQLNGYIDDRLAARRPKARR